MGKAQSKNIIETIDNHLKYYFSDGNYAKEFEYNNSFWKELFGINIPLTSEVISKMNLILIKFCINFSNK